MFSRLILQFYFNKDHNSDYRHCKRRPKTLNFCTEENIKSLQGFIIAKYSDGCLKLKIVNEDIWRNLPYSCVLDFQIPRYSR